MNIQDENMYNKHQQSPKLGLQYQGEGGDDFGGFNNVSKSQIIKKKLTDKSENVNKKQLQLQYAELLKKIRFS
jgi:hypothetical protein